MAIQKSAVEEFSIICIAELKISSRDLMDPETRPESSGPPQDTDT